MKKLMAILVAVLMFCALGTVAFAEDATVAKIGDEYYTSLQDAIDNVKSGETIYLLSNITVKTPAYGSNALNHDRAVDFTIDLGGNTISADTGNSVFRFNITNSAATKDVTVTLKNGKIVAGSNTWCAVMACGISKDVNAVLNLESLTIEGSKAGDLVVKAWEYSVINANSVTVNATNGAGGFYAVGGEIILDNCTVDQKGLYTAPYLSMAFAVSSEGKMIVNSGNYSAVPTDASEGDGQGSTHGSWVGGVMNSGGTLVINGGSFSNGNFGEDSLATAARGLILIDTGAKLEINDGAFNALKNIVDVQNNLGIANKNPSAVINGGDFSEDPAVSASYGSNLITVTPGVVITIDGKAFIKGEGSGYGVVVAKIGSKGYETLESALAAAEKGDVVTLFDNVELSALAKIEKGIELDLNGFTVTANARKAFEVYTTEEVTIKNGTIKAQSRCVDTRVNADVVLDGVTLVSTGGSSDANPQPITIGGSTNGTSIEIVDCVVDAGKAGYGIIAFVKSDVTVENSEISGYAALYYKDGSTGSEAEVIESTLNGAGYYNERFGTIVFEDDGITVKIGATTSVTAEEVEGASNLHLFTNNQVTGENAVYVDPANIALAEQLYDEGYAVDKTTGLVSHFHTGEWSVVDTATCKADGTEKRVCTTCKVTETRTVKGEHKYTDGVCGVCGDEREKVEVVAPEIKPEVKGEAAALPNYVQAEITEAAKATEVDGIDFDAEAAKIAKDAEKILAEANADQNITITDANTVIIETEVKVSIEEYKPAENEDEAPVLVLDIEPVVNVYVANDEEKALYSSKAVNTVNEAVTVTIELPEGFAEEGSVLYVLHTKDNGRQYEYKCVVENGTITFVNRNGFSSFEVSFEQSLVVIPDAPIKETVEVIIDANKETVDKDEEQNPSTGAPVMMPVLAVAAFGAAVLSKRK